MARLREGRARYFVENGLPADGGYAARWVVVRALGIPIGVFPNSASRRRAVPLHDLHHVLTGYDTSLRGEAEIAAWELASGCRDYWAAWGLNAVMFVLGLVLYPRHARAAWRRGRGGRNLYSEGWHDDLLEESEEAVRARLGVTESRRKFLIC